MPRLDAVFVKFSIAKLEQYSSEIERCLARINEQQVWARSGEKQNAIGNLVLHLCGNVSQRIAAIKGAGTQRDREKEFATRTGLSREELCGRLRGSVEDATAVITKLTAVRLGERVVVGEFDQTVLEAVYHMQIHFALHTGQIIFATKFLTGEDLGFYTPPAPAVGAQ